MTKQFYETPTTNVLVVRFQGNFLTGSNFGTKGAAGAEATYNNYEEDF